MAAAFAKKLKILQQWIFKKISSFFKVIFVGYSLKEQLAGLAKSLFSSVFAGNN
jgi:hypothetical protein